MRAIRRPGLGVLPSHFPRGVSVKIIVPRLGEIELTIPSGAGTRKSGQMNLGIKWELAMEGSENTLGFIYLRVI